MREIKYRAWDKSENQMARSVTELLFNNKGLYGVKLNHMGFEFMRRIKDVELMEYIQTIGDYEIFTKDIVKAYKHGDTESKPFICEITERNATYWFGNWTWVEFLNIFRYVEVIGNSIDNPELLEVTNGRNK